MKINWIVKEEGLEKLTDEEIENIICQKIVRIIIQKENENCNHNQSATWY